MKSKVKRKTWDAFGVSLSALCIVHCMILPLLIVAFPSLVHEWLPQEDKTHVVLLAFILGIAGFAFVSGYRVHGKMRPVLWMAVGILIISYASFFAHDQLGHLWEPVIAIAGSLALIRAHILNHRCKTCEENECGHDHAHNHSNNLHTHEDENLKN